MYADSATSGTHSVPQAKACNIQSPLPRFDACQELEREKQSGADKSSE
jgi:hypothetical protein